MSRLFGRVWALQAGDVVYRRLAVRFAADYPGRGEPASCSLQVWMPDPDLVGLLYAGEEPVRILAGYRDEGEVEVFEGVPIAGSVDDRVSDLEPSVSVELSATRSFAARARVSRSWPDVRASEVIEYLRGELGLARGEIDLPRDLRYGRGHLVQGAPLVALREVCADCGAQFSIEGARLRVYPEGGALPRTADLWAPGSGLLDVVGPEGTGEVKAAALLRPALRPGDVVAIRSPRWDGEVLVQQVRHEGQTDSERWATSIAGVPRAA